MATISIIVPVYNAEKFIKNTIQSVQKQTFVDWELILIIDGSPDNSAQICKILASEDNRLKVIEQDNCGVNKARLNGLRQCKASFITFLDSDDILPPYSLEVMFSEIKKGYDIVKGIVSINTAPSPKSKEEYLTISLNQQQFLEQIYLGDLDPYMCGSIYRRDLLDDYIFQLCIDNQISIGEDWICNLYIGKQIKKVCVINECTYIYKENIDGVMNTTIMAHSYITRVKNTADSIINDNNERWKYLKELNEALHINTFFIWEVNYSHNLYNQIKNFIKRYGISELQLRCDYRYLYFIKVEFLFYIYSRLYSIAKKLLKDKRKRRIVY